jgi:hypothetical protein
VALKPIFSRFDHERDHWQWGLGPEDFAKIMQGYACGRCLEDFNGIWRPFCPVCGEETAAPEVMDAPSEWKARA